MCRYGRSHHPLLVEPGPYFRVDRCGCTVLAKAKPLDASQLIDQSIAPRDGHAAAAPENDVDLLIDAVVMAEGLPLPRSEPLEADADCGCPDGNTWPTWK